MVLGKSCEQDGVGHKCEFWPANAPVAELKASTAASDGSERQKAGLVGGGTVGSPVGVTVFAMFGHGLGEDRAEDVKCGFVECGFGGGLVRTASARRSRATPPREEFLREAVGQGSFVVCGLGGGVVQGGDAAASPPPSLGRPSAAAAR